jgi:hypothetical protein
VSSPAPVTVGQTVTTDVNVTLGEGEGIFAYQLDILFPAFLQADAVTELGYFAIQGLSFSAGSIDNGGLRISLVGDALSGSDLMTTSGPLFQIDFTAIASGTDVVTVDSASVTLLDGNLNDVPFDISPGTVTVLATPEPSTALLLLTGMGLLAVIVRRRTATPGR